MDTAMKTLQLNRSNLHDVTVRSQRYLFHVPSSGLFELDNISGSVLDLFKDRTAVNAGDMKQVFDGRFSPQQVMDALQDFLDLDVVHNPGSREPATKSIRIENFPLSTIVLNVNTGCNLSCSYCYKEDLDVPANGKKMDFDTAVRSIELLLREGAARDRINVVFFGGEPLTNLPLIKEVVDYTERRCEELEKTVDFSLTTNATLLKESTIDYLNSHRFGISVSIDGPAAGHDRHRRTVGGLGTYRTVAEKVKLLLDRYTSRPVGARVTLTSGNIDVIGIHRHLVEEIGFAEVGFAPVTSHEIELFNLTADELVDLFGNMKELGGMYRDAALQDVNIGFSNMHQLMTDLMEGTSKSLPCGAGVGLLAVDNKGELNLCHRFTGSELPTFGNVNDGINKDSLGAFLESAIDRSGTVCETCRIRNICSGGCYHESYAKYTDPLSPTFEYCDLMRDWVDFGIKTFVEIQIQNPDFLTRHVASRRPMQ